MVALPCFDAEGNPTQEALRKFENNYLGGKAKDLDPDNINDLAIAGKRTAKFLKAIAEAPVTNRLLISPTIALASSPFLASRKVGQLVGHLGLTREGDYTDAVGRASIESRVKTLDGHVANIRVGLDEIVHRGIRGKETGKLYELPESSYESFLSLKNTVMQALKVEKMSDKEAMERIVGNYITSNAKKPDADFSLDADLNNLFSDVIKNVRAMVRDIKERGDSATVDEGGIPFSESVTSDLYTSLDNQAVKANRDDFAASIKDNLKVARRYANNKLDKHPNAEIYKNLSDDNIDKLSARITDEFINRDRTMPLTSIPLHGIKIEGFDGTSLPFKGNDPTIFYGQQNFRVSGINDIIEGLSRKTAVDAELVSSFGTSNIDDITKYIKALNERELLAKHDGNTKDIEKARKQSDRDINNLTEMVAYLRGELQRPDDYDSPVWRAERTALTLNNVRLLGAAGIGSIPEMGKIAMVFGFTNTAGEALNSFGRGLRILSKETSKNKAFASDLRAASIGLDTILSTTGKARSSMDEFVPTTTKFDNFNNWVNEKFFMANALNQVTSATKRMAGRMALNRSLHTIFDIADGKQVNRAERVFLSKYGISTNEAKVIAKQVRATEGKGYKYNFNGTLVANMDRWDLDSATLLIRNNYQAALRQITDDVIVSPGLDRPLFFTKPGWRLITQFKAFNMASLQKTSFAAYQSFALGDNRARIAIGASSMIALGTSYYMLREMMKGNDPFEDVGLTVYNGFDRSGLFGSTSDITTILGHMTGGLGNPAYYFGDEYAGQDTSVGSFTKAVGGVSVGLAGDVLGTASNAVKAAIGTDNWTDADNRRIWNLTPGQNLLMWRDISDRLFDTNLKLRN